MQLLTGLRDRGLPTDRKYLIIIAGAKALHTAIEEVFGREQEVQRCRNHKLENVMKELPKEQQDQTRRLMRAAFKLSSAEEGVRDRINTDTNKECKETEGHKKLSGLFVRQKRRFEFSRIESAQQRLVHFDFIHDADYRRFDGEFVGRFRNGTTGGMAV